MAEPGTGEQARQVFIDLLTSMGLTPSNGFTQAEINQLISSVESWTESSISQDDMLMLFRTSKETSAIYEKRFPGMKALAARGQAMSEREYIGLEQSYRDVLRSSGLPSQYYDSFDDYGRFIAGGVSAAEVEQRVTAARSLMNPRISAELEEYYGIGEGMATAFLLGLTDEKGIMLDAQAEARNQQQLRDAARTVQIGGMAEAAGFNMGRSQAELLAATTLGQGVDPFMQGTQAQLEATFNQARRTANRAATLAGIDREAYSEMDTLQAAFGDDEKKLASERRAKRERARFQGSAGVSGGSLGVERNL